MLSNWFGLAQQQADPYFDRNLASLGLTASLSTQADAFAAALQPIVDKQLPIFQADLVAKKKADDERWDYDRRVSDLRYHRDSERRY